MLNTVFSEDIVCMIEEYAPNYWRCHFSSKVLPRLNKGWQLVSLNVGSMPHDQGDVLCSNCYEYGNGRDVGCENNPSMCDDSMTHWACRDDIFDLDWWKWRFGRVLWEIDQMLYEITPMCGVGL